MNALAKLGDTQEGNSQSHARLGHHIDSINSQIATVTDLDTFIQSKVSAFYRLGRQKFKNRIHIEGLQEIFGFINQLFENFDIKKLYQITDFAALGEYTRLGIEEMFVHNIVPFKRTHQDIHLSRGGSCYHWSIFFCKLFEGLDTNGEITTSILSLNQGGGHVACMIIYGDRKFMIDVFSKENTIVKELQEGDSVFAGENRGRKVIQRIFSKHPLTLENEKGDLFSPQQFSIQQVPFLSEQSELRTILQIRTYRNGDKLDLFIERTQDGISIFFNEVKAEKDNKSTEPLKLTFSKNIFLEKVGTLSQEMTSFEMLERLIGYLSEETMEKVRYISEKISQKELYSRIIRAKQAYLSGLVQ